MNSIKNTFSNKEKITYFRFKASVLTFIIINFLFFLNYFFAWANFFFSLTTVFFPYLYILMLVSFLFLVFYSLKYRFPKLNTIYYIIIFIILFLIIILFSIFIIFGSDILNYLN